MSSLSPLNVELNQTLDPFSSFTAPIKSAEGATQASCSIDTLIYVLTERTKAAVADFTMPGVWWV